MDAKNSLNIKKNYNVNLINKNLNFKIKKYIYVYIYFLIFFNFFFKNKKNDLNFNFFFLLKKKNNKIIKYKRLNFFLIDKKINFFNTKLKFFNKFQKNENNLINSKDLIEKKNLKLTNMNKFNSDFEISEKNNKNFMLNCNKFFKKTNKKLKLNLQNFFFEKKIKKNKLNLYLKKFLKKTIYNLNFFFESRLINNLKHFFCFFNFDFLKFFIKKKYIYINFKNLKNENINIKKNNFIHFLITKNLLNINFYFLKKQRKYYEIILKKKKYKTNTLTLNKIYKINFFKNEIKKNLELDYLSLSFFFFNKKNFNYKNLYKINFFLYNLLKFK